MFACFEDVHIFHSATNGCIIIVHLGIFFYLNENELMKKITQGCIPLNHQEMERESNTGEILLKKTQEKTICQDWEKSIQNFKKIPACACTSANTHITLQIFS